MKYLKQIKILMLIGIILSVLIISIYSYKYYKYDQTMNLFEEYGVNISNNESLVRCSSGKYQKVTREIMFICDNKINPNYHFNTLED